MALLSAVPAIASSLMLYSLMMLILAVLGVNLFKGVLYHCVRTAAAGATAAEVAAASALSKEACLAANGSWLHVGPVAAMRSPLCSSPLMSSRRFSSLFFTSRRLVCVCDAARRRGSSPRNGAVPLASDASSLHHFVHTTFVHCTPRVAVPGRNTSTTWARRCSR